MDSVNLTEENVRTVIWATGCTYECDHPGLYFLGLHWMHTFKSGLFAEVGSDAEHLAEHMARST